MERGVIQPELYGLGHQGNHLGDPDIQSDVVINHGNSGGPLIDENGAVVGISVSGMEISGAPVGINLFIPIEDALKALALTPAPAA